MKSLAREKVPAVKLVPSDSEKTQKQGSTFRKSELDGIYWASDTCGLRR